jgi:hypothetical protein
VCSIQPGGAPPGSSPAGHDNQNGRQISIREGERINGPAFAAMIRQIAEHNRAGGSRSCADPPVRNSPLR